MKRTVLIVTSLEDVTADWVVEALNRRDVPVVRVDPADLGHGLRFAVTIGGCAGGWSGRVQTGTRDLDIEQVGAVYYRRPSPWRFDELPEQAREFAVAEARSGLGGLLANLSGARYVNHPAAIARADVKPAQLQVAAGLGFAVPPTLITNDPGRAREFAIDRAPVVYKSFRGLPRSSDGNAGALWTQRVDPRSFDSSLETTAHLFQAEVPKTGDARVTVVADNVFAHRITSPTGALDWRSGDWDELDHTPIAVPEPVRTALLAYLAHFRLIFGCFDFALTGPGDRAEDWIWIECNPNGQWGRLPDRSRIIEAFADILTERLACIHAS